MADLTPEETAFFQTGELPASLAADQAAEAQRATEEAARLAAEQAAAAAPALAATPAAADNSALERLLEEERNGRRTLEAKLADIERQLTESKKPPVEAPDENNDPLGAMLHKLNKTEENLLRLEQTLADQRQQTQLQTHLNQFASAVRSIKDEFVKTTPDFPAAYDHIRTVRTEDLRSSGVPESDIPKLLLQDEFQITQAAIARGKNPAAEMYAMAKRYGYAAKSAAAPAAAPATTPEEKLAAIALGQAAAAQPDKAGAAGELPSITSLRDASSADLNRIINDPALWTKLGGGDVNDIFH